MRWTSRMISLLISIICLPHPVFAISLNAYEQAAASPAKQNQIFKEAYATAVARTLAGLRSSTFPDGKQKKPERIDRDKKMANIVEGEVGRLTDDQSGALVIMIDRYAQAQPNTQLEDVIIGFLLD